MVLSSYAPSLTNFRGYMLHEMVNCGHKVIACAPGMPAHVSEQLESLGVEHASVFMERTGTSMIADLKAFLDLRRVFSCYQPDVVFLYNIKPVVYGSLAAKVAGVPKIYSMISGAGYLFTDFSIKRRLIRSLILPLYRAALRNNSKIFFQNPDDQYLFESLGLVSNKTQCVLVNGSGVDTTYFCEVPLVMKKTVFLLIARLIKDKGIIEYVEAARLIQKKKLEADFYLLGPLDSNPSAIDETQVKEWHNEGIINYLGETQDVRPFIEKSSVYVLPSYREGTPRTVLEAMSMGRPIITTDAPGCRETVIHGKNGFLVPVKDANALAEAMETFILQPDLIPMMGRESRKLAVEKYDVRKVNSVILDVMGLR